MRAVAFSSALALLFCAACSSHSGASDGTGGGSDSGAPVADAAPEDDAGTADAAFSCAQCTGNAPAGAICVVTADAELVDTTGAPVSGETLFLCGTNLCSLPVKTDAAGKAHFDLCFNMTKPALKYLGGPSYASFAVAMTQPTQTFPPVTLFPLPATGSPLPDGGGTVTSGPVTLALTGAPTFDPTLPSDPSSLEFRAGAVDPTHAPPNLDPSLGIKALWGLAPLNAAMSPAGTLTIPNPDPTDWTAGTQVDFVLNGMDEGPNAPAPYGGWAAVSTGTVSADAQTISTTTDGGVPILGMIGVGPHQ